MEPVTFGAIERLDAWSGTVNGTTTLPFTVANDDWLLVVTRPLDGWNGDRDIFVGGFTLNEEFPTQRPQHVTALYANVTDPCSVMCYRVHEGTGAATITTPDTVTAWVALVLYRGANQSRGDYQWMLWKGDPFSILDGTFVALPFGSPDGTGICVRVLGTSLIPALEAVDWPEYDTGEINEVAHWTSPLGSPVNGSNVYPGESLRVTITDEATITPTTEQTVTSQGSWDDAYSSGATGSGLLVTVVLTTTNLAELDTDPLNPAPVGPGRLPIGGVPFEEPLGIVDEEGNLLTDEDGNVLIWS